jgi:hypothetical protein
MARKPLPKPKLRPMSKAEAAGLAGALDGLLDEMLAVVKMYQERGLQVPEFITYELTGPMSGCIMALSSDTIPEDEM